MKSKPRPFGPKYATLQRALGVAVLVAASNVSAQDPPIVGETTMVIGQVKLIGGDGSARSVDRGTLVRVGDRIETQAGGHVHLRFVDGGRLSIRPASVLKIEDYSHSAQQPVLGAIKFRLDEGVVRSITGAWGEAARDRFRLNTPVAAIGVKGTDFVVRSDGGTTSASVYTGAIMLTPLANGCVNSVGPCLNGREKLLSEDMKGVMLELSRQQSTPQIVPSVDLLARGVRPPTPVVAVAAAPSAEMLLRASKPVAPDPAVILTGSNHTTDAMVAESRAVNVVASLPQPQPVAPTPPVLVTIVPPTVPEVVPEPVLPPPEPVVVVAPPATPTESTATNPVEVPETPAVVVPEPVVPLPEIVAPPLPPQVNRLVWARYDWIAKMDADTFTRGFEDAMTLGLQRLPGNGSYTLFRPVAPVGSVLITEDTKAEFRLAQASVQLVRQSGRVTEPVDVTSATLNVDFTRSTFSTQLGLQNPAMGADTLVASGSLSPSGILQTAATNGQAINGALTLDGREAGYAFEKIVPIGNVRGVTLWGR